MFVHVARRFVLALAAVLVAAALAGCGGADDARKDIAATLRTALTTNDPAVLCRQTLSAGLVERVYGGTARCLAVQRGAGGSRASAKSVEVSRIRIDGDHVTAFVALRGGDENGARGGLKVIRQDGGWRLDDLSTAFLRSEFTASITNDPRIGGALSSCVAKTIVALDDGALRRLGFGAMGGRPEAQEQLRAFVGACVTGLSAPPAGDVT